MDILNKLSWQTLSDWLITRGISSEVECLLHIRKSCVLVRNIFFPSQKLIVKALATFLKIWIEYGYISLIWVIEHGD
jgi:hypothetical protein